MRKRDPRPLEGKVEGDALKHAKRYGWLARKMNGFGFRAWPDRLFIPPEHSKESRFWVEFKRFGEEATPEQQRIHATLRNRGETVYVIDNHVDFVKLIGRR